MAPATTPGWRRRRRRPAARPRTGGGCRCVAGRGRRRRRRRAEPPGSSARTGEDPAPEPTPLVSQRAPSPPAPSAGASGRAFATFDVPSPQLPPLESPPPPATSSVPLPAGDHRHVEPPRTATQARAQRAAPPRAARFPAAARASLRPRWRASPILARSGGRRPDPGSIPAMSRRTAALFAPRGGARGRARPGGAPSCISPGRPRSCTVARPRDARDLVRSSLDRLEAPRSQREPRARLTSKRGKSCARPRRSQPPARSPGRAAVNPAATPMEPASTLARGVTRRGASRRDGIVRAGRKPIVRTT